MKNKTLLYLVLLILISPWTAAEENTEAGRLLSITEERRDTLKYGIESEVLELLAKLKDEKDSSLLKDIEQLYNTTVNTKIQLSCLDLFLELKDFRLIKNTLPILEDYDIHNQALLISAMRYVSEGGAKEALPFLEELLNHRNTPVVQAALTALGKLGGTSQGKLLMEKLEDEDFPSQLKPDILRTLGEMNYKDAVPMLIGILEDENEPGSWRWNACEALGRIGDKKGLAAIQRAYNSSDATLRSYTVLSMRYFKKEEVEDFLIDALRDSFWRVRVQACTSLGEIESKKALSILQYKARRDPENNVRIAAIKALGKINHPDAFVFLRGLFMDENAPLASRQEAFITLAEKDLENTISSAEEIMVKEWDVDKSRLLDTICKGLSTAKSPKLEALFSRMLGHKELTIKIYALRGIGLNGFISLKERVEELTRPGTAEVIRRHALTTLDALNSIP